ncbi:hypothetical protein [Terriglobus sp.]|uniref:hypothetical protein n=1 Tax=Terriglobus sp. TaxID=1889013 RepID=UPI003B00D75F
MPYLSTATHIEGTPRRGIHLGILLTALLLCSVCFAYVLVRWPDNFFADDSYFYFQVAWNFAHGRGSTFNGLMPTNGYHPLWMLACAAVYRVVQDKVAAVHAIGGVITGLNLVTLCGITGLLRRAGVAFPAVAWLMLLPFLFTSQLGTEGALSAACLTLTLFAAFLFARRPTPVLALGYALGIALTVLSRLDNIFVVAALTVSMVFLLQRRDDRKSLQMLLAGTPIVVALWAFYLWTNRHFFGTWQPISGVLKAHSDHAHRLGTNLPHIALFDLLIVAICLPVLWRVRRDLFLWCIELPLAIGVGLHAFYIVLVMSSETRWSWYYTTWTLLASLVFARAVSAVMREKARFEWPVLAACCAVLLALAARNLHVRGHDEPASRDPGFQANVVEGAHLTTLLAFDKPGRIAYYSTAHIIPLDGLMGNLRFQQELGTLGIAALDRRYRVDGFVGPPQPLTAAGKQDFCNAIFLSATRFRCAAQPDGTAVVSGAEVYARLSGRFAGTIPLPRTQMVWTAPDYVAVWRLEAQP